MDMNWDIPSDYSSSDSSEEVYQFNPQAKQPPKFPSLVVNATNHSNPQDCAHKSSTSLQHVANPQYLSLPFKAAPKFPPDHPYAHAYGQWTNWWLDAQTADQAGLAQAAKAAYCTPCM